MTDRCPVCDRERATRDEWVAEMRAEKTAMSGRCYNLPRSVVGRGVVMRHLYDCEDHRVDWRARALGAEVRAKTAEADRDAAYERAARAISDLRDQQEHCPDYTESECIAVVTALEAAEIAVRLLAKGDT